MYQEIKRKKQTHTFTHLYPVAFVHYDISRQNKSAQWRDSIQYTCVSVKRCGICFLPLSSWGLVHFTAAHRLVTQSLLSVYECQ